MDVSRLTAIDVHTHVHCSVHATDRQASSDELEHLFGWMPQLTVPELAAYYRERSMAAAGVRTARRLIAEVLFGSDFPALTPQRWLDDFAKLDIKDEVRPLILKENAARLFGLGSPTATDGS